VGESALSLVGAPTYFIASSFWKFWTNLSASTPKTKEESEETSISTPQASLSLGAAVSLPKWKSSKLNWCF
jgi:hypothetical protein